MTTMCIGDGSTTSKRDENMSWKWRK